MKGDSQLRRLAYTKYIYEQGIELANKKTSISSAMAILSFQDASEQFLMIIADKLGFKPPNNYLDYWEEAKKKKKSLPNKNDMSKLNKMRVSFKHHGILPTFEDCKDIQYKLHDFFARVSHDILIVDFSRLSLADLIEFDEVKEYIKNAEKYIEHGNYEESITESAKALKLLEKKKEGDAWHSFILEQVSFNPLDDLVDFRRIDNELLIEALREVRNRLNDIIPNLNIILMGINIYKYQRFKLLTPIVHSMQDGSLSTGHIVDKYKHRLNYNEENALFCLNFVIDTGLKFQSESFGLINRNKFQTIKTRSDKTKVYSYVEKIWKEIGVVEKDKIFDNARLTLVFEEHKDYWRIDYKGEEGYLEVNDTDWIRETEH